MQNLLNLKYLLFLIILVFSQTVFGQSITIDQSSVGLIIWDEDIYAGTGFVLNNKKQVLTCAHVIDTSHVIFYKSIKTTPNAPEKHRLKLVKILPQYDLALLESDNDLCANPLINSSDFNFSPYQHLFYLGYDVNTRNTNQYSIQANNATIASIGKTFENGTTIDFIEFIGVGRPGYSGGPVINDDGEVIGIMREAWLKRGIKGGQTQLINRAFSISPIVNSK